MNLQEPGTRQRLWTAIGISVGIALICGFFGFFSRFVGLSVRPPLAIEQFILAALFRAANVAAVAFWIVFPVVFLIHVPDYFRSPASRDWDRRMRLAEEIFKREKAHGRGSWWM